MSKSTGIFTIKEAMTEHKFSQRLASELSKILPINRWVTDFGCGKGTYLLYLSVKGFRCIGIEGTQGIDTVADFDNIINKDLSKPITEPYKKGSSICLEVIEHIPVEYEDVVIRNITKTCTGRLILSWAVEGQGGCGHVNERNAEYVIPRIEQEGFRLNQELSDRLRTEAGKDLWWFKKSIYVFDRVK